MGLRRAGARHGSGTQETTGGEKYVGSGSGTQETTQETMQETTYDGSWFRNMRHGYGIATYGNGARYEGQWHKGLQQGLGVFVEAGGIWLYAYNPSHPNPNASPSPNPNLHPNSRLTAPAIMVPGMKVCVS